MEILQSGDNMSEALGANRGRALSLWQKISYAGGEFGVGLLPTIVGTWLLYFYTKGSNYDYLPYPLFAIVFIQVFGRVVDAVVDPLVGYYSDKWTTKFGRRRPWVLYGTPFLFLTGIALWFPPVAGTSWWNFIWLTLTCGGFWLFFTVVVAPYLALLPEITPFDDERAVVSSYMGVGDVFSMIVAFLLGAKCIETYKNGVNIGPFFVADGYKIASVLLGLLMAFFFFMSIGWVKERPHSKEKEVPFKFWDAWGKCLSNEAFVPYVISMGFFRIGVDIIIMIIPFLVDSLLFRGQDIAGYLQAGIGVVGAIFFYWVVQLGKKHGKKKILMFGMLLFTIVLPLMVFVYWIPGIFGIDIDNEIRRAGDYRLYFSMVLFSLLAFSVATSLVFPRAMVADVIDLDAKKTGFRREAMYNGMEGVVTKSAAGIAIGVVALILWLFGNGDEIGILGQFYGLGPEWGILLCGPVAGLMLLFGYYYLKKYPIIK